jgi:uncharacterized protein (DUF58 family)
MWADHVRESCFAFHDFVTHDSDSHDFAAQNSGQRATMTTSRAHTELLDLDALMRIRSLELRARIVVDGLLSGLHRSPYHGFSVEFTEYRQYSPGDDPRFVDWRVFARSDRYFVKRFEDETNLRCYLVVDQSRSMSYGSLSYTKANYAVTLGATLATFLSGQRDAVGLVTFADEVAEYLPPRYRPGHLRRLLLTLDRPLSGRSTDLAAPLRYVADLVSKRGLVILISDLLAPIDTLDKHLGYLRSRGHEVVVFQILDPAELGFQFREATIFQDLESGRELYVDPSVIGRQYQARMAEHRDSVRTACERHGIELHGLATDNPLDQALFDYLRGRLERNRRARGRRARA